MTTTRTNSTGDVTYAAVNNSNGSVTLTSASNTAVSLTSSNFGSATSVTITATLTTTSAERLQGADDTYTFVHTIRKLTGGVQGDDAPRSVVSFVYHQVSASSAPTKPTADSYNISNNTFTNLSNNWATTPPTFAAGNANKYWYSYFTAVENTAGGNTSSGSNLVFQNSQQGIGFSGLVTFSSGNLVDGASTYNPATIINSNSTTIDGGKITTNSIVAAQIASGTITLDGNLIGTGTLPASKGGTGLTSIATLTNSGITINANGTLSGAGSGQVDTGNMDTTVSIQDGALPRAFGTNATLTAGFLNLGASSGARIVLNAADERIEIYDS